MNPPTSLYHSGAGNSPGCAESPAGEFYTCPQCGCAFKADASRANRAARIGSPLHCGKVCAGVARRKGKTTDQKRAEKAAYDAAYRAKNAEMLRVKKARYHEETYDPQQAAIARKRRMPWHVEYCRRPEYREKKQVYDQKHRAEKTYGDFAECFLLVMKIRGECLEQSTDYDIRQSGGTLNKKLKRRMDYDRTHSNKLEIGSLGNASISESAVYCASRG